MSVTSPRTWSVGDLFTAAIMNAFRDLSNWLLVPDMCEAQQNTVQSIPNSVLTAITLDNKIVDTNGTIYNAAQFTVQTTGTYDVSGQVAFASNGTGRRIGVINHNTTAVVQVEGTVNPNAGTVIPLPTRRVHAAVGDTFTLLGQQISGGALNSGTGVGGSVLSIRWVANI